MKMKTIGILVIFALYLCAGNASASSWNPPLSEEDHCGMCTQINYETSEVTLEDGFTFTATAEQIEYVQEGCVYEYTVIDHLFGEDETCLGEI